MAASTSSRAFEVGRFGGKYSVTLAPPPWWRPLARRRWLAAERERELLAAGFGEAFPAGWWEDDATRWARRLERRLRRDRVRQQVIDGRMPWDDGREHGA